MAMARFEDLRLDAGDPAALGAFWAAVLDRTWESQDNGCTDWSWTAEEEFCAFRPGCR